MTDAEMAAQARINIDLARQLADPSIAGDRQNEETRLLPKVAERIITALLNSGNCLEYLVEQKRKGS